MSMKIEGVSEELGYKIEEYLDYAEGLSTCDDIRQLVEEKNYDVLKKVLMNRLTFGTAGLRGRMGPGYAAMNDLVIIQTSQGLAAYIEELISKDDKKRGVVIGYDNRYNSQRFAQLAAVSFLLKDFKVYVFSSITPTPFVPFAVKVFRCLAGVMVTASHNPKEDNGYKVYWSNGAQILPPHDKNIQESILRNLKPWPNALDTSLVVVSPLAYDLLSEVEQLYFHALKTHCSLDQIVGLESSPLIITFTAMHGVSHSFMKKAFQKINFENYVPVKEQMYPDPDFPTVKFPNPEEENCLNLSIAAAEAAGSRLILANDPDADRLAVAEKLPNGDWHVFTGNEVGALLGSWLWKTLSDDVKKNPSNCCMVSSAVSSKILRSISEVEGFAFYETLTGFKWMANKAFDCINQGMKFIFAFEEAIGYMCGSTVLDKDGIRAALQMTQMAAFIYSHGGILCDLLRDTYLKYGYHVSCNSYFICHDPAAITSMFDKLRNFNGVPNEYPKFLEGDTPFPIVGVRDLTTGFDSLQPDQKAILPCSSSTQMITFYFENGCEATIRTSGTEPKVKFYTEIIAKVPHEEWANVKKLLIKMVDSMVDNWMQPKKNGFLPRPK
ncbi:phosphoglucomutase-2 [Trichonephila inaurata madagascariensis]|uniref:Phosphoglucomutase-2 n=1 Tax=Trichonephila inaurata madagascariensis TaxID=2747483 RepID=A0A8X6XYD7_9ARAC|nr:phosphoglucomutase-2 [Trichonephila inaurata madagascariensis]